ncbi:ABC transporter ATP-binding protein [Fictibacillus aquaticus]|uniref:ABC transporter ATP-binding protein n=1 Tax=Fictibacillus aquaticus TaxID=2021314 RepID=A0A235FDN9_9BACL|nr:ABC transporter ATP-binding protein [Fictibacillus aquaticus]OYD59476.1 ABC transporter ATP-binding protein [Fictibacillus aquaticus]
MAQLELQNVSLSFGEKQILDSVNLHVNQGEFVTILGPSGSGKSTLFHLIGGLLQPEKGSILLDQNKITGERGHISYMPQSASLLPWRTVLQNVILGQELTGVKDTAAARQMLQKAGLAGYENAYPHELSGGMKQRAAFIRALLSPQSVICLDEPFSALDELTRLEMQKWLLSIWQEHQKTILFVTHNIDEALFLSDRIVVLSQKPARVLREFEVPFPRPRSEEILLTPEFLEVKKEVYYTLKQGASMS